MRTGRCLVAVDERWKGSVMDGQIDGRTDMRTGCIVDGSDTIPECDEQTDGRTDGRTGCSLDGSGTISACDGQTDRRTDELGAD